MDSLIVAVRLSYGRAENIIFAQSISKSLLVSLCFSDGMQAGEVFEFAIFHTDLFVCLSAFSRNEGINTRFSLLLVSACGEITDVGEVVYDVVKVFVRRVEWQAEALRAVERAVVSVVNGVENIVFAKVIVAMKSGKK